MREFNRRHFPRQNMDETVQVYISTGFIKHRKDMCASIPARMVNKSEDGLLIELDSSLQPGSNIKLKMVALERDLPEIPYHMKDGLVIWCQKADDETACYGAGVKILRKVVRADILNSRFAQFS